MLRQADGTACLAEAFRPRRRHHGGPKDLGELRVRFRPRHPLLALPRPAVQSIAHALRRTMPATHTGPESFHQKPSCFRSICLRYQAVAVQVFLQRRPVLPVPPWRHPDLEERDRTVPEGTVCESVGGELGAAHFTPKTPARQSVRKAPVMTSAPLTCDLVIPGSRGWSARAILHQQYGDGMDTCPVPQAPGAYVQAGDPIPPPPVP